MNGTNERNQAKKPLEEAKRLENGSKRALV